MSKTEIEIVHNPTREQLKRQPVEIQARDLVTFPQGMECTWRIRKPVRKHYLFGD